MSIENEEQLDQIHFEQLIQGMLDHEYGGCDDFISTEVVNGLREKLLRMNSEGLLQMAGMGKKELFQNNTLVRGDNIKWMDNSSNDPFEKILLSKIRQFMIYLNRTCYTSVNDFELHYARYEQRSFYKRHVDQFQNDRGRKFSLVLYLNKDWLLEDGGVLSLYPKDKPQVDISPSGGKMMFFKSDQMEHEVHPSFTRERMSLAGWLKSV